MAAQVMEPTDGTGVAPAPPPVAVAPPQAGQVEATAPGVAPASPARRRFLKTLLGFSVLSTISMIAAPIVGFLIPPKVADGGAGGKVLAGTLADIPVGTGKVVALGSKPVIVVDTEAGVKAFSAVCTHLGCIVGFDDTVKQIVCPCHDGHFSAANGAVVSGPPPQPLAPVAVSVEKDSIYLVPAG
jgi:cytochrome b6-f complex iron-sulfur subunit